MDIVYILLSIFLDEIQQKSNSKNNRPLGDATDYW